jgi:hypothetical protein
MTTTSKRRDRRQAARALRVVKLERALAHLVATRGQPGGLRAWAAALDLLTATESGRRAFVHAAQRAARKGGAA